MERISPRFLNTFPPDKMLCHPYWMAEPPFRIWGNLYFVGNSWCSSHLIDTGDGLILLDTPCLAELPYLLDSIWSVGFNPREIRMILISHAHHDHYGAASALRHITGAKICLSAVDAADMAARPEWFHRHNRERIPRTKTFGQTASWRTVKQSNWETRRSSAPSRQDTRRGRCPTFGRHMTGRGGLPESAFTEAQASERFAPPFWRKQGSPCPYSRHLKHQFKRSGTALWI